MSHEVPAGWPEGVPSPSDEEFEERVVTWLLDLAPPQWRNSALRNFPGALAWSVEQFISGQQVTARAAYSRARSALANDQHLAVEPAMAAWQAHGVALAHSLRQIGMVRRALGAEGA